MRRLLLVALVLVACASVPFAWGATSSSLVVVKVSVTGTVTASRAAMVALAVRNAGSARSGATRVRVLLSTDRKVGRDVLVGTVTVPAVKAHASLRISARVSVPFSISGGKRWLVACASACVVGSTTTADGPDLDRDGYTAKLGDCAPADPAVHPGARDVPDLQGADTNCDGVDGDAAGSVFLYLHGLDTNPGTRVLPVATLTRALAIAGTRPVLVSGGSFSGNNAVPTGQGVYGAYTDDFLQRTSETWITGTGPALVVDGATAVVLQRVSLLGGAPVSGSNVVGLRVVNGGSVTLEQVSVDTVGASAGYNGSFAATGAGGEPGLSGMLTLCALGPGELGGAATVPTAGLAGTAGGAGGRGGNAVVFSASAGSSGAAGSHPSAAPGASGGPGGFGDLQNGGRSGAGGNGQSGARGGDGAPGAGGLSVLVLPGGGPTVGSGGSGATGTEGSGGGGGGGSGGHNCFFCSGADGSGGGGGGAGGAPGGGGGGGFGGGSAIGVYVGPSSSLTLVGVVVIVPGAAGAGGDGAPGGAGGIGGHGGFGGPGCASAGPGGAGGTGGDGGAGGPGGGGAGGWQIGIVAPDGAVTGASPNVQPHGSPGRGGASPSGGSTGAAGEFRATISFTP